MKRAKTDTHAKSERLTITLGEGQRRKIAAIARLHRTSAATVIRWALDQYIAERSADLSRAKPRLRSKNQ